MRESPAIPLIKQLINEKAEIKAFDPIAKEEARKLFDHGKLDFCDDIAQTIDGVDVIALLTRWEAFEVLPELLG